LLPEQAVTRWKTKVENILPSVGMLGALSGLGESTIPKECCNKFCWQGIVGFLQYLKLFARNMHIQYIVAFIQNKKPLSISTERLISWADQN